MPIVLVLIMSCFARRDTIFIIQNLPALNTALEIFEGQICIRYMVLNLQIIKDG